MRKISIFFILIMLTEIVLAGVRPVQIIRCAARVSAAKTSTTKAIVSTDHLCSGLATSATLPDSCDAGTVTMTIAIPGDFIVGDALTILSMSNMIFADGTHLIVDTLTTTTTEMYRPAFVADTPNLIEIEFTRDIYTPSQLVLRNADNGTQIPIVISACAAPISTVPTMGEWGLMSLGLLLLIFGINAVRQTVTSKQVV